MKEQSELPSLEKLGEALERFDEKKNARSAPSPVTGGGAAARMGLELVCGVMVGLGVGLYLDKWLGTSPFLMVICLFFGAAAGVLTLYKTAQRISADAEGVTHNKGDGQT